MLLHPLTVAAGLLAFPAAQGFLVPPEVSDADIQVADTIESIAPHVAENQLVEVDCPGCPVLMGGKHGRPSQVEINRPTHLELDFSIDHQPEHDRLLVNGFELYPSASPLRATLLAPQVVHLAEKEKRHRDHEHRRAATPHPQRLGFGLHIEPPKKDADGMFELVEVELQIIEVGPAFVNGVPNVRVKLIKDAEGRLLMSQIIKGEPNKLGSLTKVGTAECTTTICRWLAAAREKLKSLKTFRPCHGKPSVAGGVADPHRRPQWRVPYQERRLGKLFQYIASHILLPVFVGIVAGVSISLIGMAVGTVVVSVWRILFRCRRSCPRRRRSHAHRKACLKEAAPVEEKSSLMEHQDAPPAYEDEETTKTSPA